MSELAVMAAVDVAIIGLVVIYRQPKWLIPIVILGLPIEYFNTQSVDSLGTGGISGALRALLNPGKLAMMLAIAVAVIRFRHEPKRLIPDSTLILPLIGMMALITLGLFWSDTLKAPNSVLILPLYVAFVFVAPTFVEDRRDLELIAAAFFIGAITQGALAVTQRFGFFNWRTVLENSDEVSYRANGTFSDPNNLCRFLAVSITLAAGMILVTGPRRICIYLAVPALAIGGIGAVATASRSGWLMVLLCGFLIVVVAPVARGTKSRLVGAAAVGLFGAVAITLLQGGADAQRLRTLTSGNALLGQREFLIRAGWAMFKANPLVGVGSGNYQHALLLNYIHLIPDWAQTTLSHTSFITIVAEQGILGAAMFLFVGVRLAIVVVRKLRYARDSYDGLFIAWLGIAILGIVLHSQSEGRLIDEPFLWLLIGLFVAMEVNPGFMSEREAAESVRAPVPTRAARADRTVGARPVHEPGLATASINTTD